ncbi:pilus assembly protein [bacterium]|nr:pilus assembly protein [bacterium]
MKKTKANKGASVVEFALLMPIIFLLFLAFTEVIIFFQSASVTELAAFSAARSFQVYGDRDLASINYRHGQSAPYTHNQQSIAEASAEKIIFESLMWEHAKIKLDAPELLSNQRSYYDGDHVQYDGSSLSNTDGSVGINFIGCRGQDCAQGTGVKVYYCLPIIFPGAEILFSGALKKYPCKGQGMGRTYQGIAIQRQAYLGREPVSP